jgi:hypothetical protein
MRVQCFALVTVPVIAPAALMIFLAIGSISPVTTEPSGSKVVILTPHGVQYHVRTPIIGRNGSKRLVEAAWIIEDNQPPRLTTVLIPNNASTDKAAALEGKIIPNLSKEDWQVLYDLAHSSGMEAAENWTPTPMFVREDKPGAQTDVVSEGECGSAWVCMNGKSSLARWLKKHDLAMRGYPSGVWVFSKASTQSVQRSIKYCEAFASVLRIHGIPCTVHSRLD